MFKAAIRMDCGRVAACWCFNIGSSPTMFFPYEYSPPDHATLHDIGYFLAKPTVAIASKPTLGLTKYYRSRSCSGGFRGTSRSLSFCLRRSGVYFEKSILGLSGVGL